MSDVVTDSPANTSQGDATSASATSDATQGQTLLDSAQTTQPQQATEGQTDAGQQAAADQTKDDQTDKPQGAPEKYEFKAPEGSEFDTDVIGAYSEVAKELNLSQDAAQKVIDKIAPVLAEKQTRVLQQARTDWGEASKVDKEFGGEKLSENLATAKKALDQFGTPELRKLLDESGLGNHPEMIRVLYRAGKAISQDGFVSGAASNGGKSQAERLYPTSAQKG